MLPWTALPFYFAGFWIRRYNFFLFPHHRFDKLTRSFILVALVTMYFTATPLGMRTNNYPGNFIQVYLRLSQVFLPLCCCARR